MKTESLKVLAIKKASEKIDQYEATIFECRGEPNNPCSVCDDAKIELEIWRTILESLHHSEEEPIKLEVCKCEMPAKEHKINRCWRCKKPLAP